MKATIYMTNEQRRVVDFVVMESGIDFPEIRPVMNDFYHKHQVHLVWKQLSDLMEYIDKYQKKLGVDFSSFKDYLQQCGNNIFGWKNV